MTDLITAPGGIHLCTLSAPPAASLIATHAPHAPHAPHSSFSIVAKVDQSPPRLDTPSPVLATQCPSPSIRDAESAQPPESAVLAAQKWNDPPVNRYRTLSCCLAFLLYGMNDGAVGAMVPLLEAHYALPHSIISLVFLSPMVGCVAASFTSTHLHTIAGRRGVAAMATGSYAAAYIGLSQHPPFGVVIALMVLTGFGSGLMNGSWNSWAGGLAQGTTLLGCLHGFWGIGATLAPIIASRLTARGFGWWVYYYLMIGLTALAATGVVSSFWNDTGSVFSRTHGAKIGPFAQVFEAFKDRITLMVSAFLLLYVGAEVTIGGWLLTFMVNIRKGTPSASSLVASGFWIGLTCGRFTLGWLTGYVGERPMVAAYLLSAIGLELAFWFNRQFVVSAIMAALIGLSIGMIFPASIRIMTGLLPPEKHIVSVGFATAFAVSGSAVFPFLVGALAQAYGLKVLQPVILTLFGLQLVLWGSISLRKFKVV